MSEPHLITALLQLCREHSLLVERDVKVGPYLAPLVIQAYDPVGVGRDVRILVEPRHWSPPVAQRMAPWAQQHRERLRGLATVDFVAIIVEGADAAPEGLSSLGEFGRFLDGFAPPTGGGLRPSPGPTETRGDPVPTLAYEQEVAGTLASWTGGGIVFCAMPFAAAFDPVFFDLIAPATHEAGLIVMRTDQEETLQEIERRIHDGIRKADLMVADVTGHNPNVMYEIGVAHAFGKQTLLLRHDKLPLPFDVHYHEVFDYTLATCAAEKAHLAHRLRGAAVALWQ